MTKEAEIKTNHNGFVVIGRVDVDVPGLKPDLRDGNGKVRKPSNLLDLSEEANKIFSEKPWYRALLTDVRKHRKSAIFITSLGSIAIFVAGAAGFEFGVRHGRDLNVLPKILKRKKK